MRSTSPTGNQRERRNCPLAGAACNDIVIVRSRMVVDAYPTNKLFSARIDADGRAGTIVKVTLDRPLKTPDGQLTFGGDGNLIVDEGEGGRLMHIKLSGEELDTGKAKTLKTGFAHSPASVPGPGASMRVRQPAPTHWAPFQSVKP